MIISLEIPADEKNNPELIAALQDRIIEQLKRFQTENIKRYRYVPQLAISVDQAGLSALAQMKEVAKINADGISQPQINSSQTPCAKDKTNSSLN